MERSARCIMQGRAYGLDYYLCGADRVYTFSTYKKNKFESRDECENQGRTSVKFDTLDIVDDLIFMSGERVHAAKVLFTLADIMSDGQEVEHVWRTKFDLDGGPMRCVRVSSMR